MIAKKIKAKRRFVKLFELNNFITLLHVYVAYGKIRRPIDCSGTTKTGCRNEVGAEEKI